MLENRNLHRDLFALAALAFSIFLIVSLATYHPGDSLGALPAPIASFYQVDMVVYPPSEKIQNACGWWGAVTADLMFNVFGYGAYYACLSFLVLDIMLLLRRPLDAPVVRLFGWFLSLLGLTTLTTLLLPDWSPGPVVGAGGILGLMGRGLLETRFALAGASIIATSVFLGGLLMCSEYTLLEWFGLSGRAIGAVGRHGKRLVARRGDLGEEQEEWEDIDDDEVVPVRGKGLDLGDEAETDEDAEEAEELEDEVTEEPPAPVVKKRAAKKRQKVRAPHFAGKRRSQKDDREEVMSRLDEASIEDPGDYELPDISLLIEGDDVCFEEQVKEVRRKAKILERTFANFGFTVKVVEIETGPVIAQYEVQLEAGLRLSKITGLADDLAIALRVPSVRIVAPIPGKNTVGIEVPNEVRQVVRLREVIEECNGKTRKMKIPLFLGKDVSGNPLTVDLATLPHLLIAGRTGTGKSVCLNAIISSILMTKRPDEVRLLLIDPKMVELSGYGRLPHLMHPVVTDMRKAEAILAWAVEKMEERYSLLARAGVRHITGYNQLGEEELMERLKPESEEERHAIPLQLPFIVIVADEMADLMMTAGKEVEQHIIRLAQKSRAVGIHLILATQKPTVDVITGLIKSNLPARIAFQVASRTDSRVVLDEMGAERLLGNGDMLFLWPGTSTLLRGQGTYLTDDEINRIVDSVSTGEQNFVHELVNLKVEDEPGENAPGQLKNRDELYEAAVDIVVREGRGSVSLLQRCLGIGYGRAARLIDFMAEDGIVGPYAGSQAREVLITIADWERMQGHEGASEESEMETDAPPVKRRRSNKVLPEPDDAFEEELDEDESLVEQEEVDGQAEEAWDEEQEASWEDEWDEEEEEDEELVDEEVTEEDEYEDEDEEEAEYCEEEFYEEEEDMEDEELEDEETVEDPYQTETA